MLTNKQELQNEQHSFIFAWNQQKCYRTENCVFGTGIVRQVFRAFKFRNREMCLWFSPFFPENHSTTIRRHDARDILSCHWISMKAQRFRVDVKELWKMSNNNEAKSIERKNKTGKTIDDCGMKLLRIWNQQQSFRFIVHFWSRRKNKFHFMLCPSFITICADSLRFLLRNHCIQAIYRSHRSIILNAIIINTMQFTAQIQQLRSNAP